MKFCKYVTVVVANELGWWSTRWTPERPCIDSESFMIWWNMLCARQYRACRRTTAPMLHYSATTPSSRLASDPFHGSPYSMHLQFVRLNHVPLENHRQLWWEDGLRGADFKKETIIGKKFSVRRYRQFTTFESVVFNEGLWPVTGLCR